MTAKEVRFWSGDSIARNGVYALERYLDVADIPAQQVQQANTTYLYTCKG